MIHHGHSKRLLLPYSAWVSSHDLSSPRPDGDQSLFSKTSITKWTRPFWGTDCWGTRSKPSQTRVAGFAVLDVRGLESARRVIICCEAPPQFPHCACEGFFFFRSSPEDQQQFANQTLRVHLHGVDFLLEIPRAITIASCRSLLPNVLLLDKLDASDQIGTRYQRPNKILEMRSGIFTGCFLK